MGVFPVMCVRSGQCTAYPDVCLTTTPAGPQPIPYPNLSNPADGGGSEKVKTMNSNTLRKGDKINRSSGDNAGNAPGGTVSGQFMGVVEIKIGDPKVKVERLSIAFHTVQTVHNGSNANAPTGGHIKATQFEVKVKGVPRFPPQGPDITRAGGIVEVDQALKAGQSPVNDSADQIRCSPLAKQQTSDHLRAGGTIRYTNPGDGTMHPNGSWCSRSTSPPTVVIAQADRGNPAGILTGLSHELGHALFAKPDDAAGMAAAWQPNANGQMQGADYKRKYLVEREGRDEGAATMNNVRTSEQAQQNCGSNVPVAGNPANSQRYRDITNDNSLSEEEKQRRIGDIFHNGEMASTTGQTYGDLWGSWPSGQQAQAIINANPGILV